MNIAKEFIEDSLGFKLNMQIIADKLEDRYGSLSFHARNDKPVLIGARFFRKGHTPTGAYVYFVGEGNISEDLLQYHNIGYVAIGDVDINRFPTDSSVIILPETAEFFDVYEEVLNIFACYQAWDTGLQRAVYSDTPLNEMLEISVRVFQNPIFIHDNDFYILACPYHPKGMTEWDMDSRTGREMVPLNLINIYRIDPEYIETLKTREPTMFLGSQRGYRILYANLWDGEHYEGRICVNEMQAVIKQGDYLVLEYLSKLVGICTMKRNLVWKSLGKDIERFMIEMVSGRMEDKREVKSQLEFMNWGLEDRYICIKLGTDQQTFGSMSPVSALSYMESQIGASHAFVYEKGLVSVINLTAGKVSVQSILSSLSFLMREGLFKVGVSDERCDFMGLPYLYQQADVALECGRRGSSMIWSYHYRDYAMDYFIEESRKDFSEEFICARELYALREYDREHHTELFETLDVYLQMERNVVQTAKKLFVHRSTLFYRLERIQSILHMDLDNPDIRLYLEVSFSMMR